MKNVIRSIAGIAAALGCAAASAAPVVLTFEGAGDLASINNFYNGGTDSTGHSGTNYGISFGTNALAVIDADAGGSGNIANEPSGQTAMFFLTGSAVLNYAPGFTTGFSFFYSSSAAATINVYDGLNATGNVIATLALAAQAGGNNCVGDPNGGYCNWTAIGATFSGTARSIDFGGGVNATAYDNITFGSATAGDPGQLPEPASLALVGLALLPAAVAARRRKHSL